MPTKWDPLEVKKTMEITVSAIKRHIKNILKSYTGWYDPFSELIQNALDATDEYAKIDKTYEPQIWIRIDLHNNLISVTDNGIGFSEDEFKNFLAPDVSFKKSGTRGNKGVGATYLAYGFNYLQIGTKTPKYSFTCVFENGRNWIEDESGTITRPYVQETAIDEDVFAQINRGSTFTLKLTGNNIRPKDLQWVKANTVDQWETILKLKTPLGGIYVDTEHKFPKCNLTVVDEHGIQTTKIVQSCEYIYPHTQLVACATLNDIKECQKRIIEKNGDPSKLPGKYEKLNGLYNTWNHHDLSALKEFKLEASEIDLVNKYSVYLYGFFCYSTILWDKLNDDIFKLHKKSRILRGGLQLATNNMLQGDLLIIPLTKNIGYQNVAHIIIHFKDADPDLGRKGFQPELKKLAENLSTQAVRLFLQYRRLLKQDTGAPPDIIQAKNIHDWISEQELHEKNKPLRISREDVFLPIKQPSITSEPLNEQDVVALFNQLLAGGVIRGIRVMATNQHEQYDGVFRFCLTEPFDNHIFDKDKNPLGIDKSQIRESYIGAPEILEYKYSIDALLEDFEKGEKNEKQIGLVIAWEMGQNWKKRYDVLPYLHFDNIHHRYFHGGTHLIKNPSTGDLIFPAIILSELISYINDPVGAQQYQYNTYIDEHK